MGMDRGGEFQRGGEIRSKYSHVKNRMSNSKPLEDGSLARNSGEQTTPRQQHQVNGGTMSSLTTPANGRPYSQEYSSNYCHKIAAPKDRQEHEHNKVINESTIYKSNNNIRELEYQLKETRMNSGINSNPQSSILNHSCLQSAPAMANIVLDKSR